MSELNKYTANILPIDASNQEVDWNVINITGEAEINSDGIVSPKSCGIVRITATAKDSSGVTSRNTCPIIEGWLESGNEGKTEKDFIELTKDTAFVSPNKVAEVLSIDNEFTEMLVERLNQLHTDCVSSKEFDDEIKLINDNLGNISDILDIINGVSV